MLVLLFLFKLILADVWVENGSLSLNFNDISVDNNLTLKRSYNSINFSNSILGSKWGTNFELSLKPVLGVLIQIQDLGSGTSSFYIKAKSAALNQVVTQIVKTETNNTKLAENLKKSLIQNELMLAHFINAKNLYLNPNKDDVFYAVDGSSSIIIYDGVFFIRERTNGQKEFFNSKGFLVRLENSKTDFLRFSYNKNLIEKISNNKGETLFFTYSNNLLSKLRFKNQEVLYTYNKDKRLERSIDSKANIYTYEYDLYGNLSKLFLAGALIREYAYDSSTNRVVLYKDSSSCSTNYEYSNDNNEKYLYSLTRVKKTCNSSLEFLKTYEFWYKYRADGGIYLEKYTLKEGKNHYTLVYKDFGKKPALVDVNGKVSAYFYDNLQRLNKKIFSNKNSLTLVYKGDTNKVVKASLGNLDYYYAYDSLNRINKIIYEDNTIIVDYDSKNRARLIQDEKNGVFLISYDNKDNIVKISTGEGELELKYASDGSLLLNSFSTKIDLTKFRNVYQAYLEAIEVFKKLEVAYL